ncbi:MAG: hypothetical protein M1467_00150 [Deltaproteobacteria bacterium]|nr:hypothetical protein [Deltaproteobacteria bacterium]
MSNKITLFSISTLSQVNCRISDFLIPVFNAVITIGFKYGSQCDISRSASFSDKYLNLLVSPFKRLILTFFSKSSFAIFQSIAFLNIRLKIIISRLAYATE